MNNSSEAHDETMAQPKEWIYFLIITICVAVTQSIAFFATPEKTLENRKYVLNILALYTMVVQWIVFLHAGGFFGNERTEKYYDLTGSLTYMSTLAISLYFMHGKISTRQVVLAMCVAVWSARLGWFLFSRIHDNNGIDSRFTIIKASRPRFMMAWTLQGAWVFLTILPVLMLNQSSEDVSFGVFDYCGIPLWIIGFLFEVVADFQKSAFRKLAQNKDKFIHTGLWSISRHPNYFGEIMLWLGIAICAFGGLSARPRAAIVFLSPVFVAFLLIYVSGIPLLEQKADKKFGDDDNYIRYKKNTPVLVPFLGRTGEEL